MLSASIKITGLLHYSDPQLMRRAEAMAIERAVEITEPIARAEAPSRTGRGKTFIIGIVETRSGRPVGRIYPTGKAFYLRILSTGAKAHEIRPFRFRSGRMSKQATRALAPGRARGASRALRFTIGGQMLFRRFAMIPALPANPFMDRAAVRASPAIAQAAELAIDQTLNRESAVGARALAA